MHRIPVSTGELLDKMSILKIKIERLPDPQATEAQKEFAAIALGHIDPNLFHYYTLLKKINEEIWIIQQELHEGRGDPASDYPEILAQNDRRFRIKQKINRYDQSDFKEQKSYGERKCIVYGHLGMGDMYWNNGAVRFFSTIYDQVVVVCKKHNAENTVKMYEDDDSITVLTVPYDVPAKEVAERLPNYVMIACGIPAYQQNVSEYPNEFYSQFGIPPSYRTEYFYHAYSSDSVLLSTHLIQPYTVVHDSKSSAAFNLTRHLNPDIQLTINIGRNLYPVGHRYHDLAQRFVGLPLHCYIDLLQNADELHLVESSLACLASHLDLSNVKVKRAYEASEHFLNLGVFEEGKL